MSVIQATMIRLSTSLAALLAIYELTVDIFSNVNGIQERFIREEEVVGSW